MDTKRHLAPWFMDEIMSTMFRKTTQKFTTLHLPRTQRQLEFFPALALEHIFSWLVFSMIFHKSDRHEKVSPPLSPRKSPPLPAFLRMTLTPFPALLLFPSLLLSQNKTLKNIKREANNQKRRMKGLRMKE
ncbi:hypothetical protein ACTXT7_007772 [Hymenolepis weldensis]